MARAIHVSTREELSGLRHTLHVTREKARRAFDAALKTPGFMESIKFLRLGCDPLDPNDAQNLIEQINQQATYTAAIDALERLWDMHPGLEWVLAPGAHGSGHDIVSTDGTVAAEVFAAVKPGNNNKLRDDIDKVSRFEGPHRYVFYRSPDHPQGESTVRNAVVVSLGFAP